MIYHLSCSLLKCFRMKYFASLLFIFIPVSLQSRILKDGDLKCRYRVHLPAASWHTAYDVCRNSTQELATTGSTADMAIVHDVLESVDRMLHGVKPIKNTYSDIWIGAFMRSSSNHSMHLNCKTFRLPVVFTDPRSADEIVCIYYNFTDLRFYVDNCTHKKAFLCENKSKAKANCTMISLKDKLRDAAPYLLSKNEAPTLGCNATCCKNRCMEENKHCYAPIWDINEGCISYSYTTNRDTDQSPLSADRLITHKSLFIFKKDEYPVSAPQPLSAQCPEMTPELIQEMADRLKTNLTVNRKETNKFKRTLISAPDERRSAKNMGMVGVTVICLVAGVFVFFDCVSIFQRVKCIRPRFKAD